MSSSRGSCGGVAGGPGDLAPSDRNSSSNSSPAGGSGAGSQETALGEVGEGEEADMGRLQVMIEMINTVAISDIKPEQIASQYFVTSFFLSSDYHAICSVLYVFDKNTFTYQQYARVALLE